MILSIAETDDIESTLELHCKYQVDSIAQEDKSDGFVTTPFTKNQLLELVQKEQGLFIARQNGKVVAYAMAASWQFWSAWPIFAHMIKGLSDLSVGGQILTVENTYQYGPVCIDKSMRGSGLLQVIFINTFKYVIVIGNSLYIYKEIDPTEEFKKYFVG